jgi:hypothetical protein
VFCALARKRRARRAAGPGIIGAGGMGGMNSKPMFGGPWGRQNQVPPPPQQQQQQSYFGPGPNHNAGGGYNNQNTTNTQNTAAYNPEYPPPTGGPAPPPPYGKDGTGQAGSYAPVSVRDVWTFGWGLQGMCLIAAWTAAACAYYGTLMSMFGSQVV